MGKHICSGIHTCHMGPGPHHLSLISFDRCLDLADLGLKKCIHKSMKTAGIILFLHVCMQTVMDNITFYLQTDEANQIGHCHY
jgi:hypothetical protein